jgi:hypothetical protein
MRYFFPVLLLSAILLWSCAGKRGLERGTSAVHVSEDAHPADYTLVYTLPKTTLKVTVEATRVITRRGPYYQFAERYLGISGVPAQNSNRWRIDNVKMASYQEADPDQYYVLRTNDRHVTNYFRLNAEGFILPVSQRQLPELEGFVYRREQETDEPLYTDLSIHPSVVEETRTVMRMVRQDTAFVNVPVLQRQTVTRSLDAKAAEAADLIFELRSNRFKLLSGDLDLFPDGRALEAIIDEFARLEREYLDLFTGKVFEEKHQFTFEYTPNALAEGNLENHILFRLSDTEGILPAGHSGGRPVSLELTRERKTDRLNRLENPPLRKGESPNQLFYRIPDVARVSLKDGNETIARSRILVSQYGRVVTLPANFLWE